MRISDTTSLAGLAALAVASLLASPAFAQDADETVQVLGSDGRVYTLSACGSDCVYACPL